MTECKNFIFVILLVVFYLLFLLSLLPTATAVAIRVKVRGEIEGDGFHRVLKYHIDTGNFVNKSCYVAVFEELPSSVYVNVDELADLRRGQKSFTCVEGEIDVELFGERASDQDVSSCARLSSTKMTLSFPIHQRYHFASSTGEPIDVELSRPIILLGCKDRIKDHRIAKVKLCSPCDELTKKWRDVFYDWEGYADYEWKIPVGNTNKKFLVTCLTHLVTLSAGAYVLWTIYHSFRIPKVRKVKDN